MMSLNNPVTLLLALSLPLLALSCSTQSGTRGDQGATPNTSVAGDDDSQGDDDSSSGSQKGDDDSGSGGQQGDDDSGSDGQAGDDDSTPPPAAKLHGDAPAQPLKVPTFEALNSDGSTRTTPDLLGHPTVLWFFPYAGTPV